MANHKTGRDSAAENPGAKPGLSRKSKTTSNASQDVHTGALRRSPEGPTSRHLLGSEAVRSNTKKSANSVRAAVELSQEQIVALAAMGQRQQLTRAALMRQAVAAFLAHHSAAPQEDTAFGLWRARQRDGLHYQLALRSEWDA